MNLFGNSTSLPTHSNSARKNNGISGVPTVNKSVAISFSALLCCIAFVIFGIWHCRSYSYNYHLQCDDVNCMITSTFPDIKPVGFARSEIADVEMVQINKIGEVVDPATSKQRKEATGYSFRFKLSTYESEVGLRKIKTYKHVLFTPHDMGRRGARTNVNLIKRYTDRKTDSAVVDYGKSVTLIGVLGVLFGFIGFGLTCLFGEWTDPAPRRLKKAS